jgi:hypothetical protein
MDSDGKFTGYLRPVMENDDTFEGHSSWHADNGSDKHTQTDAVEVKFECRYENSGMSLADWRWAAQMGYWDPEIRQWNERKGGMRAYIDQRDKRRIKRQSRQPRAFKNSGPSDGCTRAHSEQMRTNTAEYQSFCDSVFRTDSQDLQPSKSENPQDYESTIISEESPLHLIMDSCGWGHHVVRRYWNAGYEKGSVYRLYTELPVSLRSAISETLDAAQLCADSGIRFDRPDLFSPSQFQPLPPEATLSVWEKDTTHAYIERRFHSDTQLCVGVAANSRAAALLGMRREDLLAQLERGDVPLPLPPLDAVAVFLHALGTSRDAIATRYFRLVPPAVASHAGYWTAAGAEPGDPPAVLVCSTSAKRFDTDGRVVKVRLRVCLSSARVSTFILCMIIDYR